MSDLTYAKAIILGVLQGLTEFLPVSSSGHLAIAQRHLGLAPDDPTMLRLDVMTHVGTVAAVVVIFFPTFRRYTRRLLRELERNGPRPRYALRIACLGFAATAVTATIGLGFKEPLLAAFGKPTWIGWGLITTGVLLAGTKFVKRGRRGWGRFTWWHAALVGLVQGLAILPGISRSGATICVASFCGLRRRWAAEFSFFIAVPAILGAAVLELGETLSRSNEGAPVTAWGPTLLGSGVAFVAGLVALRILLTTVQRGRLHYFALYCWLVGSLTISGVL